MKLQVSNTNVPTWRDMTVKSDLPAKLKHLEELAKKPVVGMEQRGKSPVPRPQPRFVALIRREPGDSSSGSFIRTP